MFSFVQNITSALRPLEATAVDSRFREKQRDSGTGGHRLARKPQQDTDEDYSTLSVRALILFLEDFLEVQLGAPPAHTRHTQAPWLKEPHSNDIPTGSGNAAKAYAHAARTRTIQTPVRSGMPEKPDDEELKHIYLLIQDLRHLQKHGQQYLNIENNRTFLDSIARAVEHAKQNRE